MNERKALALDIVQPEFGVGIPAFVDAMPSLTVWTSDDLAMEQVGNGEYVEVFVSSVITPNNFCLQLKGTYTTERLELLMDELELVLHVVFCFYIL